MPCFLPKAIEIFVPIVYFSIFTISCWKQCKNCECCPCHSLFKGHKVNVNIARLSDWNQYIKCHVSGYKSLGLQMSWWLSWLILIRSCLLIRHCHCLCHYLVVGQWSCHISSSLWSDNFKVTSIWSHSLRVFSKCLCLFVSQVMSPHHSDQMSDRWKVTGATLWGCSPIAIVIVIKFVIVFLLVRSCLLIALITCFKSHKSVRVLHGSVSQQCWESVTRSPIELSGDS